MAFRVLPNQAASNIEYTLQKESHDIDFHHGNGSQDIFYGRDDVFFASLHGHPEDVFPYFSGMLFKMEVATVIPDNAQSHDQP